MASPARIEPADRLEQVRALRQDVARVQELTSSEVDTRVATAPALTTLLPGGALKAGCAYAVQGSTALAMALMAGPATAGAWCGVVDVPSFGVAAATGWGLDPERTVLIPDAGEDWLQVLTACIDALGVVVFAPRGHVPAGVAARLGARLRSTGAVLVVLGAWPRSEVRLRVDESRWEGIGQGHGYLRSRVVTASAVDRIGTTRQARLRLGARSVDLAERVELAHGTGTLDPTYDGGIGLRPVEVAS